MHRIYRAAPKSSTKHWSTKKSLANQNFIGRLVAGKKQKHLEPCLVKIKAEVSDPVVLSNFLSADGVSSPRPRPYVTTFTRIPWLHTQRGLPLYAVLSPHWIKVVGYKESFLLGLQQSRVTDRPVFWTKHSIKVITVERYNYLRLILTQTFRLLLL